MVKWEQLLLDVCFDDGNDGHFYTLSNRLEIFLFVYPKGKGRYGRSGNDE